MFKLKTGLIVLIVTSFVAGIISAQEIKETLFKEANNYKILAQKAKADVLAPKNYGQALKYYQDAEQDIEKGKNLEGIRKKLQGAVVYFKKAEEATRLANVTLSSAIKARSDAWNAEAPNFSPGNWQKAEEKFAEGATKLENGDVNGAKKRADEAQALFKQVELEAIKANYLNETRTLIEFAEKDKVEKEAPLTLRKAKSLLQQAEKELNENRYDTDVARNLAQQAKYEVKHAIYLANFIRQTKKEKKEFEDIILVSELPLQKVASSFDVAAKFDEGYEKSTKQVIDYIKLMQDSVQNLNQNLAISNQMNLTKGQRIVELESKLGDVAIEKSALTGRIEAEAKVREQFLKVERMFSREEGRVMREGNNVLVRLIGLNFPVGKSVIEPQYFKLLTKVQQTINIFPNSKITIEGHTDSFGGDDLNLKLSQQRSDAVKTYLMANMGLSDDRINSVGFGESQPIANNETSEGRTKNRRIDVVIKPEFK